MTNYSPYMAPGFISGVSDLMRAIAGVPVQMKQEDNRRQQLAMEQQRIDIEKERMEREGADKAAAKKLNDRKVAAELAAAGDPGAQYLLGGQPAHVQKMPLGLGQLDIPDTGSMDIASIYVQNAEARKAAQADAEARRKIELANAETSALNAQTAAWKQTPEGKREEHELRLRRAVVKAPATSGIAKALGKTVERSYTEDEIDALMQKYDLKHGIKAEKPGVPGPGGDPGAGANPAAVDPYAGMTPEEKKAAAAAKAAAAFGF